MDQIRRLEPLLPLAFATIALGTFATGLLAWSRAREGTPYRQAISTSVLDALLVTFFVVTLILTLGPVGTLADRRIDLIPFRELQPRGFDRTSAALEMVGNVVLFAPLGFLAAIRYPALRSLRTIVAVGICLSLGIEALQLALDTGREASVTDVVLNALGSGLGYGVFLGASRGRRRHDRRNDRRYPEGRDLPQGEFHWRHGGSGP